MDDPFFDDFESITGKFIAGFGCASIAIWLVNLLGALIVIAAIAIAIEWIITGTLF